MFTVKGSDDRVEYRAGAMYWCNIQQGVEDIRWQQQAEKHLLTTVAVLGAGVAESGSVESS